MSSLKRFFYISNLRNIKYILLRRAVLGLNNCKATPEMVYEQMEMLKVSDLYRLHEKLFGFSYKYYINCCGDVVERNKAHAKLNAGILLN